MKLLLALLLSASMFGQQNTTPSTAPSTPQLSETEKIAVTSILEKYKTNEQVMQDILTTFRTVEVEIKKEHPGYHLDESTLSLVKDSVEVKKVPEKK